MATTIYNRIKAHLEENPQLRERRFSRDWLMRKALGDCDLFQKWYFQEGSLTIEDLITIHTSYDSWRHEWGKVLLDNEELRGEDYKDKIRLSQEVMMDRGYESGYHETKNLFK